MKIRGLFTAALLAAIALAGAEPNRLHFPIQEYKLDNGLRVILSVDHSAPTYSVAVTYNVGSRDERQGRTGFAHLFEHMMFQGSDNVGKGEHFILVQNYGGEMNGTTNQDRTNYFEAFPANQLDLGLYLEADRMRSLAINQSNLNNQRNAVQEEKRLGEDNQAYGQADDTLNEIAYQNFANSHSVIGSMADLDAATVDDVKDFFRIYYAPNNAVLTLVGDFDPADAMAKVKKYFGGIPPQTAPPAPNLSEPAPNGEKTRTLDDAFAQLPRVDIGFRNAPGNSGDNWALNVLAAILGQGQSSRLYQALVKQQELAVTAVSFESDHRGPSLFQAFAIARPGKNVKELESALLAEIDRLKNEPVADWELEKARRSFLHLQVEQAQRTLPRAMTIGEFAVFYNDPGLINTMQDKIEKVTKEDIQRVARKYLSAENRAVVFSIPKPKTAAAGGAH